MSAPGLLFFFGTRCANQISVCDGFDVDYKKNLWGFSYSRPRLEEDYTRNLWELPSRFFNVFLKYNGIVLGFDLKFRRGLWGLLKITKWKIAEKFQGDSKVIMRIKKTLHRP